MAQLRRQRELLERLEIEVLISGPESSARFAAFWKQHEMPFRGFPDPQHHIAGLYGQEVRLLKLGRMPAQVLIAQDGLILHAH